MAERPFHPELENPARWLPRTVLTRRSYPLVRAVSALLSRVVPTKSETVRLAGGRRILVNRPKEPAPGPVPALLWIHGGGLVIGAPEFEESLLTRMTQGAGILTAAPDYRLAPKHPYPAALEDLYAALCWLARQPGVDPARLAIGGDSAGGGLAACLAIHATRQDGPRPAFLLLHEPMLDEASRRRPFDQPRQLRMWNEAANRFGWEAYLAGLEGEIPATASAARAGPGDLARLPPTWLGVGTVDLFHDETGAFAERLREAGRLAGLVTVPGAFHGFATVAANAGVTRAYVAKMRAALEAGLGLATD